MTKQEFLAMSLPYRICCEILDYKSDHVGTQYDFIVGINQWSKDGRMWSVFTEDGARPSFDRVKPVLHQLSDLTKEIEHKGDKFVPINRLKNFFGWDYLWNCHKKRETINPHAIPYACFSKLIEWNFDLFGGVDSGEAIDVNTLTENPYK